LTIQKERKTQTANAYQKLSATEDASPVVPKKQRPSKEELAASKKKAEAASPKPAAKEKKSAKPAKKTKEVVEETQPAEEEQEVEEKQQEEQDDEEEEIDDETLALVENLDDDEEEDDNQKSEKGTFKKGQDVGKIPKAKKSKSSSNGEKSSGKPGVMYLGRIPHGFYEHEIRSYFGQFGDITRLRVVRNKKTGASRHRAFVEFADAEVADIAARTMDKYLLFGHLLTAKVVPPEQVHPDLFKGANRRFKAVPWNKMAGKQLEKPRSESQWTEKISKEEKKRVAQAEKLKALGYEFEAPKLKAPEVKPQLENGASDEPAKAIEAAPEKMEVEEAEKPEEKEEEQPKTISQKKTPTKKKAGGKATKAKKAKA